MIWSSDFASPVLTGIGAKLTPTTSLNLWGWSGQEKTGLHPPPSDFTWFQWFNPMNTTERMGASVSVNSAGVQAYGTIAEGVQATIATLLNPVPGVLPNGYDTIVESLRQNLPAAWWSETARQQLATWGTGAAWCDFTPIGADVMAQLDDIAAGVKDIQYALLYGRGTATPDPSGFAAADFDGRLDAAVKPVLTAIAALPTGSGSVDTASILAAIADLKAHPTFDPNDASILSIVQRIEAALKAA